MFFLRCSRSLAGELSALVSTTPTWKIYPLPASTKGLRVYDKPVQQAKKCRSAAARRTDSLDEVMPALDF